MVKIGKYNISDKIIEQMNIYRKKTNKDKIEKGFRLCQNLKTKNITTGNKCDGDNCSILMSESKCGKNEISIGTFHTHPHINSDMSATDIYASKLFTDKINCVGGLENIKCFTPKKVKGCTESKAHKLINAKYEVSETDDYQSKCFKTTIIK